MKGVIDVAITKKYFFTHDVDAHEDVKIKKLIKTFGYEGYGIFWHLIEVMRNTDNYRIAYDIDDIEILLYHTNVNLEDFIKFCLKVKLLILENNFLFSDSLNKRMEIYEEIRENKSKAGKLGNMVRWGKKDGEKNIAEQSQCDKKISQSDEKSSQTIAIKEKIIKENKIKDNISSSIPSDRPNEFVEPEEEEIENFFKSCGFVISAKTFYEYQKQNNWEVNGEKIQNWKALAMKWNSRELANQKAMPEKKSKFVNYDEVKVDYENFDDNNLNKLLEKYGG